MLESVHIWPSWRLPILASSVVCLHCTTTLDPASLNASTSLPDDSASGASSSGATESGGSSSVDASGGAGCGAMQGMAGAAFASCVELLPCTTLSEETGLLVCPHALSFDAALHECQLRGGHLAEVNSEAENSLIAMTVEETVGTNVWLGARRSEAFVWAWQHSQLVFWRGDRNGTPEDGVFVQWAPGEPNNSSTVSDEPEKCLALTLGDIDWNDRACSLTLPFVCELD